MLNKNFDELRAFCRNDKHHQILDALIKHNGHYHKAAIEIDTTVNTVASVLFRMRKMAAKQGTDPEGNLNFKTPAGFTVDRVSSFIDDEGAVRRQWVIANRDKSEQWEAFEEAVRNLAEIVEGKAEPVAAPIYTKDELMVKYPLADMHLGLLTHAKEVESDFDLKIAKQIFSQAMEAVVNSSPNAHTALILDLGDTIHTDDSSNQTKASKHNLDVDGRFDKVFDTALMILITMIDYALTKHQQVIFRKTRGNHDPDMSIAISGVIEAWYRNEPRVKVERSPSMFWWFQFGNTLHFSTHGHTVKHADLPEIMAKDCESVWSFTKHRYIDTGHIHHANVKETRTAIIESHNSMTAGDSYNYGHGYRSKRILKGIVYHKTHGEIQRNIVDIGALV